MTPDEDDENTRDENTIVRLARSCREKDAHISNLQRDLISDHEFAVSEIAKKDKQIADQEVRIKDLEEKISRKDAYIHWLDAAYHHQYEALEKIKQGDRKL